MPSRFTSNPVPSKICLVLSSLLNFSMELSIFFLISSGNLLFNSSNLILSSSVIDNSNLNSPFTKVSVPFVLKSISFIYSRISSKEIYPQEINISIISFWSSALSFTIAGLARIVSKLFSKFRALMLRRASPNSPS